MSPTVASTCTADGDTLCLNNGRFKVEATFNASGAQPASAHVVKLTDETGYLWFFSATNVEAVIKVLNGCGSNNRYWVFAGGLTNVRTVITITDTKTGHRRPTRTPRGPRSSRSRTLGLRHVPVRGGLEVLGRALSIAPGQLSRCIIDLERRFALRSGDTYDDASTPPLTAKYFAPRSQSLFLRTPESASFWNPRKPRQSQEPPGPS